MLHQARDKVLLVARLREPSRLEFLHQLLLRHGVKGTAAARGGGGGGGRGDGGLVLRVDLEQLVACHLLGRMRIIPRALGVAVVDPLGVFLGQELLRLALAAAAVLVAEAQPTPAQRRAVDRLGVGLLVLNRLLVLLYAHDAQMKRLIYSCRVDPARRAGDGRVVQGMGWGATHRERVELALPSLAGRLAN